MRTCCFAVLMAILLLSIPGFSDTLAQDGGFKMTIPTIDSLNSRAGLAESRQGLLKQLHEKTVDANLAVPLDAKTEDAWEGAFWGMALCQYRTPAVLKSIRHALDTHKEHSSSFVRSALEAGWSLYRSELMPEMEKVARETKNPKNFAMAVSYIVMNNPKKAKDYYKLSFRDFPDESNETILMQLRKTLQEPFAERVRHRPALHDLLTYPFPENLPVVFSFQRHNRDYPGLAVIRKQDGSFVRCPDGSIFNVPQLARSLGNYDGYLTDGNTPQGILSIQGIVSSDNSFIGPTPTLQTALPYEAAVGNYFYDPTRESEQWSEDAYNSLLPDSWKDYEPIHEAYWAGKVGRGDIVVHGTTIDPEFYKGTPYYPTTPSLGCLCALELWSPADGRCLYSAQLSLIQAFASTASEKGYVVVVEIDDKQQPVTLYDVLPDVLGAESGVRTETK